MDYTVHIGNSIGRILDQHCDYILTEMSNHYYDFLELAAGLKDYYENCINAALREIPSTSAGHAFITDMCLGVPDHVFRELAFDYWTAWEEDKEDANI